MRDMMMKKERHAGWLTLLLFVFLSSANCLASDEFDEVWPREIDTPKGVIIIYQPQPEKIEGDRLFGRAAVSIELDTLAEPVFGAIWFDARLVIDKAERTAIFADVDITNTRFPNSTPEREKQLTDFLEKEVPNRQLPIDLDNLLATIDYQDERKKTAELLNNEPPKIIFMDEPAVLISIDGKPNKIEEEGVNRVINTPYTVLEDPNSKLWYIHAGGDDWYSSNSLEGEWKVSSSVPKKIAALAPREDEEELEEDAEEPGPAPKLVISTEPTELISSTGKPEFKPIEGTALLYMSNTDSDVLMDINQQTYYILLAGRWFKSSVMSGPWEYVPSDTLPADFPKIPQDSDLATVRYAVPGTQEAEDAVLDAQMPQTASVDRKVSSLEVEYDGTAEFEKLEGTQLSYAVNTATPVIAVGKQYYAVDEAVWFVADKPAGQWAVATEVPKEIYDIPPESPLYYVTFVKIYSSTPEVVYVGYTQGYTNVYVYNSTIVYGTGYWYQPWYGRYYYPRPATWGFNVRYNPRWGWSFGLSYSNGPFTFTIGRGGWYRGGWWGPSRYRGYRHGYRHGARAGYRAGYRAGQRNSTRNNLYKSKNNLARTKDVSNRASNKRPTKAASNRANNVYADNKGNIHRTSDKGWEQKTAQGWEKSDMNRSAAKSQENAEKIQNSANKTQDRSSSVQTQPRSSSYSNKSSNDQQQLNRSAHERQRGNQRANVNRSSRGGGGGRRR
ncbi:MAG: hypothetical protein V7711_11295 [Pseudomonadales bacterium]